MAIKPRESLVDFEVLDAARRKRGLSWNRVARALGLQPSSFTRWKQGINEPDLAAVVLLADYFDISLDRIVGRRLRATGQPEPESKTYVLNDREETVVLAHRGNANVRKILDTVVRETDQLAKRP